MGGHDWRAARDTGEFVPVAGVDVDAGARDAFAGETGAPVFDDFGRALAEVPADAALVAAPDAFHAPFSIEAMEAGLDVICEKPMASTLDDARRMDAAARRLGRMLMIHHQLRWVPQYHHARRMIREGAIGVPRHVDLHMYVSSDVCFHGYRSTLPHLMLKDLGIHHFDLIRFVTGAECVSVYARSWASNEEGKAAATTTHAYAILEMTGPVTVCYRSGMRSITELTGYGCRIEVNGSRGALRVSDRALELQTHERFASQQPPEAVEARAPGRGTWQAFADAIRTREPALTDSADNLRSLELLYAAIESADTGRAVALPDA
jgi:predicted dehydrogenase